MAEGQGSAELSLPLAVPLAVSPGRMVSGQEDEPCKSCAGTAAFRAGFGAKLLVSGGLEQMQHLLLEMEEEKSMRDAAVIVQPCSQWLFLPESVQEELWGQRGCCVPRALCPQCLGDVVQMGICCHCKTWLNFPELQTHPASGSSSQELLCGYFLPLQSLPPLILVSGNAPGCCSLPCACAEQAPVKHIPRVSQLGSKPSPAGLCGAWSLAGAARNRSHGNVITEEQLCASTELTPGWVLTISAGLPSKCCSSSG